MTTVLSHVRESTGAIVTVTLENAGNRGLPGFFSI